MVCAMRPWFALLGALLLLATGACARPAPAGPTPVPIPPEIRELPGRGVAIEGKGSAESNEVTPQYNGGLQLGIDVVTLSHDGQSTFIVTAVQGERTESIVRAIGAYRGQRPLVVQGPVSFQVTADGAWSLRIQPMSSGGSPSFTGTGDAVSAYFAPPKPAPWAVAHDGQTGFFVYAHCLGGSIVVEDRSGAFQDSPQVEFPRGPCFWEVRADGTWSLKPAQ
jgi:hypothetical protein